MNDIKKHPLSSLGFNFIDPAYIPKGKDEYYLRNKQNRYAGSYRLLAPAEIRTLEKNNNTADDWKNIRVAEGFNPKLVQHCEFYGLVRIGKLEEYFAEYNNLRVPIGLYYSTIISSDIGDNVVIDNVNYLSHYIIGNNALLANINEIGTTNHAKFGNGVIKKGEKESVRIWLEICNENTGRSVLPFNGMTAADAWLWSKYKDDTLLQEKLKEFTDHQYDTNRGYYGKIGERTVIKNCRILKDVWIGSDAYLKGVNKIKNITINSSPQAHTQIGEGCELVNGIIGPGCRIFYGVKAVRFVMGSNSQLKYGARLINSYLGDNSTISCCEVLNSLIFPGHEQHHNNSFLCAATVLGQSNMAAGATIGSNHNSRAADGELLANRGFWPGLCVSLKHNSKFACFTLLTKGDYPAELNIPIPFSLVSNDPSRDRLTVTPGFWFMYNMYALARNAKKYESRDKRTDHIQVYEYDFLAPDSVNEMFTALRLMKIYAAKAWARKNKQKPEEKDWENTGEQLLESGAITDDLPILAEGFENSKRKVQLLKVAEAYGLFKKFIIYYGINELIGFIERKKLKTWQQVQRSLSRDPRTEDWKNAGGQLIPSENIHSLMKKIRSGSLNSWNEIHDWYRQKSRNYRSDKCRHAIACLFEILRIAPAKFTKKVFTGLLGETVEFRYRITKNIFESRAKDYTNPFRTMMYDSEKEMEKVVGPLRNNGFIREEEEATLAFHEKVNNLLRQFR